MEKQKLEIVYYYSAVDTSFMGDYRKVELLRDGVLHKEWGDYYRDKGGVQASSYAQGYQAAVGKGLVEVTRVNRNLP